MNDIWFRRKTYGWGWTPCSWEGWLVLLVWTIFFVRNTIRIAQISEETKGSLPWLILSQFLWIIALLAIAYLKGEPPRWQWGKKKDNADKTDSL
jgi:hypothetical protein